MGHTLLRIHSKDNAYVQNSLVRGKKLDMLDYAIGYAAVVPASDNMAVFAFKGLLGGYPGNFDLGPYYMKINTYNNVENRDLWEYVLNLNEGHARRILYHLWEIQWNTYFDYWFLDENCAQYVLRLLEVANLKWSFLDSLPLIVTPAESIKALTRQKNSIRKILYRPSMLKQFIHSQENLSSSDKKQLKDFVDEKIKARDLSTSALNTAIKYFSFLRGENIDYFKKNLTKLNMEVLVARSKRARDQKLLEVPRPRSPDLSHGDQRLRLGYGVAKGGEEFWEPEFRFNLHDMLDDKTGQPKFGAVEFFKFNFRYQKSEFSLEEIVAPKIQAFLPISNIVRKLSYSVYAGLKSYRELGSDHKLGLKLNPKLGYTYSLIGSKWLLHSLLGARWRGNAPGNNSNLA